jgi:hypothetical protein
MRYRTYIRSVKVEVGKEDAATQESGKRLFRVDFREAIRCLTFVPRRNNLASLFKAKADPGPLRPRKVANSLLFICNEHCFTFYCLGLISLPSDK